MYPVINEQPKTFLCWLIPAVTYTCSFEDQCKSNVLTMSTYLSLEWRIHCNVAARGHTIP